MRELAQERSQLEFIFCNGVSSIGVHTKVDAGAHGNWQAISSHTSENRLESKPLSIFVAIPALRLGTKSLYCPPWSKGHSLLFLFPPQQTASLFRLPTFIVVKLGYLNAKTAPLDCN